MVPLCGKTKDLHYLTSMGHDVIGVEGIHKAVAEYADENKAAVVLDAQKDTGKFKPYFETYKGVDNKRGTSLQFLRGDFFLLGAAAKGVFGGVWDRASLVAIEVRANEDCRDETKAGAKRQILLSLMSLLFASLATSLLVASLLAPLPQPSMRDTYAKNMGEAMAAGGIMLLSTFWREKGDAAALKAGPPYSVSEKDVRDIYEGLDWVKSVELVETIDYVRDERFKQEVKRWLDAGMTEFKELVFVIKKK